MIPRTRYRLFLALALLYAAMGSAEALADAPDMDPRVIFGQQSPAWLRAVGKLEVPGIRYKDGRREHYLEDCSATLIAPSNAGAADTIITAWHCLEYYQDLSRVITFTLVTENPDESLAIEAIRLADGGGIFADWAIMRLRQPVPAQTIQAMEVAAAPANDSEKIIMAGYSRDLGEGGRQLSYDPDCRITGRSTEGTDSNCAAQQGASGGAVIQFNSDGVPQLLGVVSQGDGARFSTFVPVSRFRSATLRFLH
jgi:Trypsin